jgi:hypothetical protein
MRWTSNAQWALSPAPAITATLSRSTRMGRKQLIAEAELIERLADTVSFQPDKDALLDEAERLRALAALTEERSWDPPPEPAAIAEA